MYELPEIVEVGQAAELTLGGGPTQYTDNCDCQKSDEPDPWGD